jgi:histidyl-tRNA synthetase
LDKQFKYAENKNIKYWIFAWETEEENNEIMIKDLDNRNQETIKFEELEKYFK